MTSKISIVSNPFVQLEKMSTKLTVIMSRHGTDQAAVLPVPDANSLVVGAGQDPYNVSGIREGIPVGLPWLFMMEEHGPDYSKISANGQGLCPSFYVP